MTVSYSHVQGLPRWHSAKNLPASAGDARDSGSILGSGRSPGVGNGNLLQYPYLGNPMDRGGVTKGQMRLSARAHTHTHTHLLGSRSRHSNTVVI